MESLILNQIEHFFEKYHLGNFHFSLYTAKNPQSDSKNEDSLGFFLVKPELLVLAVADGAGGYPQGEVASQLILKNIKKSLNKLNSTELETARNAVLHAIELTNNELLSQGKSSKTTIAIALLEKNKVRTIHIGDSGVVLCGQKGKLEYRTPFHSPIGYGVEGGFLEEHEALGHPEANIVDNLVGAKDMRIELGPELSFKENDTLLAATDGLFDNFKTSDIIEMIRKGQLEESSSFIHNFFEKRMSEDPSGVSTKFDDTSFILCRYKS